MESILRLGNFVLLFIKCLANNLFFIVYLSILGNLLFSDKLIWWLNADDKYLLFIVGFYGFGLNTASENGSAIFISQFIDYLFICYLYLFIIIFRLFFFITNSTFWLLFN